MNILLFAAILTGFSNVDITPPVGAFIPGYYSQRVATGATTPLELQAVAFSDGSSTGLVFSADNIHLTHKTIAAAQRILKAKLGIPAENTFIASTHTHTGAATDSSYYTEIQDPKARALCDRYGEALETKILDAAVAALEDLKPSEFLSARTTCPDLAFIRRYRMKDGSVATNPNRRKTEAIDRALGAADDTVQVVRIRRQGGADIALVNFQTHPDTVSGLRYHWDWPGEFRHYFERALGDGTRCFFLNGAQGDTNHIKVMGEVEAWRLGRKPGASLFPKVMGARLAGAALAAWATCRPMPVTGKVRGRITYAKVASNKPTAAAVRAIEMSDRGLSNEAIVRSGLGLGGMEVMAICAKTSNARKLMNGPAFFEMPVSTLAVGDALAFAGFPGEPFTEIGCKVKAASPYAMTFVGCLVNDSFGYLPSTSASQEGGYEVVASRFGATCGETLVTTQLANLKALKAVTTPRVFESSDPTNVPPLLLSQGGQTIATKEEWEHTRRPEIAHTFAEEVYGVRPVGRPNDLRFETLAESPAYGGKAVRKVVRGTYSGPLSTERFVITAWIPTARRKSAAFVHLAPRPSETADDPKGPRPIYTLPVGDILARGYAAVAVYTYNFAMDWHNAPAVATNGVFKAFGPVACDERDAHAWGILSAWGWGASRALDWIETEPRLDAAHVGVVGLSRHGKAALVAGAADTRFAMTVSCCSGMGGAKLNHMLCGGSETVRDIIIAHRWFAPVFRQWVDRDAEMPFDMHQFLALVAPRLLYVSSASDDDWAGPRGEFAACTLAAPAWELYGRPGIVQHGFPEPDHPLAAGGIGYHLRRGEHAIKPYDWQCYLDFADGHGWRF